ncbi:MAG: TraB/GumN family protein [Blastocatellia bacterium]|nr:TraB/GumN family protein [Blastocatellia bacterium]
MDTGNRKKHCRKPTFIAVGAGHLGGKNGVIRLLRARGYKLTPIKL